MNVLFIGIFQNMNGARSVTERNIAKLIECFGEDKVQIIGLIDEDSERIKLKEQYNNIQIFKAYKNKLGKLSNLIQGYYPLMNSKIESIIIKSLIKSNIDMVYIDSAIIGKISKKIKNSNLNIKIITFFHDINIHLMKNYQKQNNMNIKDKIKYIRKIPFLKISVLNEKKALNYSDRVVVLNERDYKTLKNNYSINNNVDIIPISLEDRFNTDKCINAKENKLNILFVGIAKHMPNVSGLKWFIDNVLEYIECELTIIGRSMETLKNELHTNNQNIDCKINLIGTVDCIDDYYYNSDLVVVPIFEGGGMKVKTAEALMFGKVIVGTSEGFEGYNIKDGDCYICNSKEEFIRCINNIKINKNFARVSERNRAIFINNYSNDMTKEKFSNYSNL